MVDLERIKSWTEDGKPACPVNGHVSWSPLRSIWTLTMMAIGLVGGALTFSWDAFLVFLLTTAFTIGLGHSIGMHRLLIHRSFKTSKEFEYFLVWLGVLVGMAGPISMVRIHDLRDWAQRQTECHDFFGHRTGFFHDAWRQMHCGIALKASPRFQPEPELGADPVYRFMEKTWMLQQIPLALALFAIGGWSWVIWGVCLRISVSLTGHWMVGYFAHRQGHQGWRVEGAAVQGFNIPLAAIITFGESWHANHHAFPGSARLGVEPGQCDPGWRVLQCWQKLGWIDTVLTPEDLQTRPELRRVDPVFDQTVSNKKTQPSEPAHA